MGGVWSTVVDTKENEKQIFLGDPVCSYRTNAATAIGPQVMLALSRGVFRTPHHVRFAPRLDRCIPSVKKGDLAVLRLHTVRMPKDKHQSNRAGLADHCPKGDI